MTEELLDDKIENGNLTLPFSLSYVKGPFKGWKYTFFLSLILSALAGLVLYYMEYIFFRNNNLYIFKFFF